MIRDAGSNSRREDARSARRPDQSHRPAAGAAKARQNPRGTRQASKPGNAGSRNGNVSHRGKNQGSKDGLKSKISSTGTARVSTNGGGRSLGRKPSDTRQQRAGGGGNPSRKERASAKSSNAAGRPERRSYGKGSQGKTPQGNRVTSAVRGNQLSRFQDREGAYQSRSSRKFEKSAKANTWNAKSKRTSRNGSRSYASGGKAYEFASFAWERLRPAVLAVFAVIILALVMIAMLVVNSGKIANGVRIGDVDVSGMTVEEAAASIEARYQPNVDATNVYVFADEKTRDSVDFDLQKKQADAIAEQISYQEAKKNKKVWVVSSETVGASIPAIEIAEEAKRQSDESGLLVRSGILGTDLAVPVYLQYDEKLMPDLQDDINESLGSPVKDYGVVVEGGQVKVQKGSTGNLINRQEFEGSVSNLLIQDDSPQMSYVVNLIKTRYDIDKKTAKQAKDAVEALVQCPANMHSGDTSLEVKKETLLGWLGTEKVEAGDEYALRLVFDKNKAKPIVIGKLNEKINGRNASVEFTKDGKDVTVKTDIPITAFDLDAAMGQLEDAIFGEFNSTGKIGKAPESVDIELQTDFVSDTFPLKDALGYGIVTKFSSYTTQYVNSVATINRTNNIHLAADKIDKSIAKANGGGWSFNDTAGPAEAEDGYLEANVVDGNTTTTGVGGGICQVATTVFNAIYEAGLPVSERHNHSLYTSSYPAGRDAAIAYPRLDLRWSNDTESDILLTTSYTDYSITVTLIGVDPERSVKTDTGEWQEGQKFKIVYEVEESLSPDMSYIKTKGSDGMNILVVREVSDKEGQPLFQNNFPSYYSATDRVIAYGKGSDMDKLKEKYEEVKKKKQKDDSAEEGTEQ